VLQIAAFLALAAPVVGYGSTAEVAWFAIELLLSFGMIGNGR
jgi:hypothetical protein